MLISLAPSLPPCHHLSPTTEINSLSLTLSFTTGNLANSYSLGCVGGDFDENEGRRRDGIGGGEGIHGPNQLPMNQLEAEELAYLRGSIGGVRHQISTRGGWLGMGFPSGVPPTMQASTQRSSSGRQKKSKKQSSESPRMSNADDMEEDFD